MRAKKKKTSCSVSGTALQMVQYKRFAIFHLQNLPTVLTFSHRLKQIGFLQ